jgi:rhamnosyltransferase
MNPIRPLPTPANTEPVTIQPGSNAVFLAGARIFIAMATYNGERFIEEQIRSIQSQTFADWRLLVRDDGSRDQTCQLVSKLAQQDGRIRLLADRRGNQGAIGNFAVLMEVALEEGADYLFLADQDDIWRPEKLSIMLAAIQELEQKAADLPLLVHCDLEVVDEGLHPIAKSFIRFSRLSPTRADLGLLLCQNQVTGCASLFNRRLLELACPVPREVLMHDWWLALLAAASGKIGFVPLPLVRYRQHGENVLGAVSFQQRLWRLLSSSHQWRRHILTIKGGIWQSRRLAERLRERRVPSTHGVVQQVDAYAHILRMPPMRRIYILRRHRIGHFLLRRRWFLTLLVALMKNGSRSEHIG